MTINEITNPDVPTKRSVEKMIKRAERLGCKVVSYEEYFSLTCFSRYTFGDMRQIVRRLNDIEKLNRMSVAELRKLEKLHRHGIAQATEEIRSSADEFGAFVPPNDVTDDGSYLADLSMDECKHLMDESVGTNFEQSINDLTYDLEEWHDVMAALLSKRKLMNKAGLLDPLDVDKADAA